MVVRHGAEDQVLSSPPVEILLVEDSPADVRLTVEALKQARLANRLHVVGDGEEAMAFLRREPPHEDAPRPGLMLLDLNLPKMDGREVLAEVKADPELLQIPVIVLTTSTAEHDILYSYEQHANCYITKPVDFGDFLNALQMLGNFWLSVVRLPGES